MKQTILPYEFCPAVAFHIPNLILFRFHQNSRSNGFCQLRCEFGKILIGERDCTAGQIFAHMRRVVFRKSCGTKVKTAQGTECLFKGGRKMAAGGYGFLLRLSLHMKVNSCKHKGAFHQAALRPVSAGAVKSDCGPQDLRFDRKFK